MTSKSATALRIGLVLGGTSGPGSGSYERVKALIRLAETSNWQIFLIASSYQAESYKDLPHLKIISLPSQRRIWYTTFGSFAIRKIAIAHEIDVLQFETLPPLFTPPNTYIFSIHHLPPTDRHLVKSNAQFITNGLRNLLLRRSSRRASAIVTLTESSKLEIVNRFALNPQKVVAVPFSLPLGSSQPSSHSSNDSIPSGPYVIHVGHLEKRKNLQTLIKAAAQPEWPTRTKLIFCGADHGERQALEAIANKLGVNVVFMGQVSDKDKWALIRNSSCVVMPSLLEGFGIPVVEAISVGVPVLVSDRGALPEVVGTLAAVIPALDEKRWAEQIGSICSNLDVRSSLIALQRQHITRYADEPAFEAYQHLITIAQQSIPSKCDILHVAFGGLGGHRAVVEELSISLQKQGLVSKGIFLVSGTQRDKRFSVDGLADSRIVEIRHRGDLRSMLQVAKETNAMRSKFVVAHSHRHIPAIWLGQLFARQAPKLVMVEHQSLKLRSFMDNLHSFVGLFFVKQVVFLSSYYETKYPLRPLIGFLERKSIVIANGINLTDPAQNKIRTRGSHITLGMAARLIPSKNFEQLILAVSELKRMGHTEVILRIAGNGEMQPHLIELVERLDLGSSVLFDGEIDRSLMSEWYRSLDCYVHASKGETMSMAILEAAAAALPIICGSDATMQEVFSSGGLIQVEELSSRNIAQSVSLLIQEGNFVEVGEAARTSVEQMMGSDRMADEYMRMFEEL